MSALRGLLSSRGGPAAMLLLGACAAALAAAGCRSSERSDPGGRAGVADPAAPQGGGADARDAAVLAGAEPEALAADSTAARARVDETRARFRVLEPRLSPEPRDRSALARAPRLFAPSSSPALADAVATGFAIASSSPRPGLRPVFAGPPRSPTSPLADVVLPLSAERALHLADATSGAAIAVTLEGAAPSPAEPASGFVLYRRALDGADLVHRPDGAGTEEFFRFDARPVRDEVRYRVALGPGVAGLRLYANTLELLDAGGAPRLRMAAPWLVDATGARVAAHVSVEGCAVDRDPRAPWGRSPVAPGAATCGVRVAWDGDGVAWPALLDPAWTLTGSMSRPHYQHTATLLGDGRVLIAGGMSGPTAVSELYDPQSGTFALTSPLLTARFQHTATLLPTGRVLIAGGSSQSNTSEGIASCELYDPQSGTFTAAAPMGTARYWHTATLLQSNMVLAAGGADETGVIVATAELYDPTRGTWTPTGSMNQFRFVHNGSLLPSGRVLVEGGYDQSATAQSAELYDPQAGTWSTTGSLISPRQAHTSTLLGNGRVLAAGGGYFDFNTFANVYPAATELYDPATGQWVATSGGLSMGRQYMTATALLDGTVLAAGGYDGATVGTAEVYDPLRDVWTPTKPMNVIRANHTATRLGSGVVLAAGGSTSTAELYRGLLVAGAPCAAATDCASGFCADGVCCNAACTDLCGACDLPGHVGTCAPVTGAPANGHGACATDGSSCGGTCGGQSTTACSYPTGVCRPATCAAGQATAAVSCDGMGACPAAAAPTACAPYACGASASACAASCASDTDCAASAYCNAQKACAPRAPLGAPCASADGCLSGSCADGVCCNAACDGVCQACDVPAHVGTCSPVPAGAPAPGHGTCPSDGTVCGGACDGTHDTACAFPGANVACRAATCQAGAAIAGGSCDGKGACPGPAAPVACAPFGCQGGGCQGSCASDADCAIGAYCNAQKTCAPRAPLGSPCATADGCASGSCADGVCCNAACGDQCAACDLPGLVGTCSPVPAGPPAPGHMPCGGDGSACNGACDGKTTAACAFPDGTITCRPATCSAGVATEPAACDGLGRCPAAQTHACDPFVCGPDGSCLAACASDADCVPGDFCDAGSCAPKAMGGAACASAAECASGFCSDGVCCNAACADQCAACDRPGLVGTCSPVTGAPVAGRAPCAGSGPCAGTCDGHTTTACAFPGADTTCGAATCDHDTRTAAATCDGHGACTPGTTSACASGCAPGDGGACASDEPAPPDLATAPDLVNVSFRGDGAGCAVGGGRRGCEGPRALGLLLAIGLLLHRNRGRGRRRSHTGRAGSPAVD